MQGRVNVMTVQPNPILNLFISDVDECNSQPCKNGAKCIDRINSYECSCAAGYTGKHCEQGNAR